MEPFCSFPAQLAPKLGADSEELARLAEEANCEKRWVRRARASSATSQFISQITSKLSPGLVLFWEWRARVFGRPIAGCRRAKKGVSLRLKLARKLAPSSPPGLLKELRDGAINIWARLLRRRELNGILWRRERFNRFFRVFLLWWCIGYISCAASES